MFVRRFTSQRIKMQHIVELTFDLYEHSGQNLPSDKNGAPWTSPMTSQVMPSSSLILTKLSSLINCACAPRTISQTYRRGKDLPSLNNWIIDLKKSKVILY